MAAADTITRAVAEAVGNADPADAVRQWSLLKVAVMEHEARLPGFFDGTDAGIAWCVRIPRTGGVGVVQSRRWDPEVGSFSTVWRNGHAAEFPDSELFVDLAWAQIRLRKLERAQPVLVCALRVCPQDADRFTVTCTNLAGRVIGTVSACTADDAGTILSSLLESMEVSKEHRVRFVFDVANPNSKLEVNLLAAVADADNAVVPASPRSKRFNENEDLTTRWGILCS